MGKRLLVLADRIGSADDDLGRILMKSFLYSVARNAEPPSSITFMNEGVRLACADSASLDDLQLLADAGVEIRSCGTCLDYLGLKDQLAVGEVGAMTQSVASLLSDEDVLTIA